MPDAEYSTTTTGSPTVATGVAGKTVLTFTEFRELHNIGNLYGTVSQR
jgi:hypothetical protein